jgi:hypothetical protein
MAGTGDDHLSALNLKAEWETLLGLSTSAPYDSVYEAGSSESQDAVYGSSNRTEAKVWVDTVRVALVALNSETDETVLSLPELARLP